MDFTAYITLCLILVAPSCHSTREGRAAKRAWVTVSQADSAYLALIQCGTDKWSSGTIISDSMVLTYSTCADTQIVVYANFTSFDTSKAAPEGTQVRNVEKVEKHEDLKIFILNEPWKFTENVVGAVKLADTKSRQSEKGCTVLGHVKTTNEIKAQKLVQEIGGKVLCKEQVQGEPGFLYSKGANDQEKLGELDIGGPAVNNKNELLAINMKCETIAASPDAINCNTYFKIAEYREWIEEQINAAESGAPGGTGGNSTSPSSGYSIHSYLNKYSNWKVLLLCLIIIKFLVY